MRNFEKFAHRTKDDLINHLKSLSFFYSRLQFHFNFAKTYFDPCVDYHEQKKSEGKSECNDFRLSNQSIVLAIPTFKKN